MTQSHCGVQLSNATISHWATNPTPPPSLNNLIDLYEAWNKPEQANQWRAKLAQMEDFEECQ